MPGASIGVGHGQMGEAELEKTMLQFMRHEFDIFVCTTIIENGLDIPLANTMIIENAERYGLSELYQLRGRVGRSNRRAYAYLLVPPDTELTEIARKRLAALKEFSDLGAGFKIAALDLELRGAGNLLGGEQHGHINSVGFDTYVRLLEETVRELKGEEMRAGDPLGAEPGPRHPHPARLYRRRKPAPARVPADRQCRRRRRRGTVPKRNWRIDMAQCRRRCTTCWNTPALKTLAEKIGIEAVDRRHNLLNIKFHEETRVDPGTSDEYGRQNPRRAVHSGRRIAITPGRVRPRPGIFYASCGETAQLGVKGLTAAQAVLK